MLHYYVFETAGGFCGIAWSGAGIARFQLPTKRPEATERLLLRRVPGAEPGAPPPEVAEAVAAVQRYFSGEAIDFSRGSCGKREPSDITQGSRGYCSRQDPGERRRPTPGEAGAGNLAAVVPGWCASTRRHL